MSLFHPRIIATVVLCFAGSLLFAGCSGAPLDLTHTAGAPASTAPTAAASPSGGSGVLTACSLITEQEAGTALGTDPGPGVADSQGIATSCTFGTPPSVLTVNLVPTGGKAGYEHALGVVEAAHQAVTITGVGDGAFGEFKGSFATIEFYKGDALVNVVLGVKGASTPPQDQILVLVKFAAGRL